jgi:hypothetical protein
VYDNIHPTIVPVPTGAPTGGTFTLTYLWDGFFFGTAPIAWNATTTAIESAIAAASPAIANNVYAQGGTLPTPIRIGTAGTGILGDITAVSINTSGLTGGSYAFNGSATQNNLYVVSRAGFGTVDPGSSYASGSFLITGPADVLVAGGAWANTLTSSMFHAQGHQYRASVQVQDSAFDVTSTDNSFSTQLAIAHAIDGSASLCRVRDPHLVPRSSQTPTAIINGATDTAYWADRYRGVLASLSAAQSIPNATLTTVANWQVVEDTDGFLTSANTITIPKNSGIRRVEVICSIGFQTSAAGDRRVRLGHNGSFSFTGGADTDTTGQPAGSNAVILVRTGVIDVVGGDTFAVQVLQSSGGAINIQTAQSTWLQLKVIEG